MLLFAIEVLLFPLAGCFLVIYAFVSAFIFFGAPYNGVYKFSAVFYPGVELWKQKFIVRRSKLAG